MSEMTDEDREQRELAAFESRMRAKRFSLAIAGLILVGGVLVWRCSSLVDRYGVTPSVAETSPGIEVDVGRDGRITVRGCTIELDACVAQAKEREYNRPGGGRYRALVHVARGAPQDAVRDARGALLVHDFVPKNVTVD